MARSTLCLSLCTSLSHTPAFLSFFCSFLLPFPRHSLFHCCTFFLFYPFSHSALLFSFLYWTQSPFLPLPLPLLFHPCLCFSLPLPCLNTASSQTDLSQTFSFLSFFLYISLLFYSCVYFPAPPPLLFKSMFYIYSWTWPCSCLAPVYPCSCDGSIDHFARGVFLQRVLRAGQDDVRWCVMRHERLGVGGGGGVVCVCVLCV